MLTKRKKNNLSKCDGDTCPMNELLSTLASKWSVRVICKLEKHPQGRARFSLIKQDVSGISQRMLTITLRNLERDGLVKRYIFPETPPRVEYELTELGKSVLEPMEMLTSWINNNWDKISKSRKIFDKAGE